METGWHKRFLEKISRAGKVAVDNALNVVRWMAEKAREMLMLHMTGPI
ncbi:MAG: hypothetical protein IPK17_08490 [Chloroflexi bacterium]|nr:hypothetical protein [Chloroflexota bacterium]